MKSREQVVEYIIKRVLRNPWIPHEPTPKQAAFLALDDKEALYGGAAGGGKSDALLMGALQFVDVPGYNALLLRKTYRDLALPESIMFRSHEWLGPTPAKWNGQDYRWTFPSGATLTFGYLNNENDKYRYQSSAYQYIGFDELTQFELSPYLYLFSRLRRLKGSSVPIRMRTGTNPGGVGHFWVYERFIVDSTRIFVPALLTENPYLDQDAYRESLAELDETERRQLEFGEWVSSSKGKSFDREWWRGRNRFDLDGKRSVIARFQSWDTALTNTAASANSACITGEILSDYTLAITNAWTGKPIFPELPDEIRAHYHANNRDLKLRAIVIEGAASGKPAIQTLRAGSDLDIAQSVVEFVPKESKEERAARASVWCKRGLVRLPYPSENTPWLDSFERELFEFPDASKKDQVDAFSQLILYLENYLISSWHGVQAKREFTKQDSRVQRELNKLKRKK